MNKKKVGIVSYLNSQPYVLGLESQGMQSEMEMVKAFPADLASMLKAGEIELALLPIGALLDFENYNFVGNHGIASFGAVRTVCLFSEKPIQTLSKIYLDYQSRTSVKLLEVLLKEHFHHSPELVPATPGFETEIAGDTGGLVIGDRAMGLHHKFEFAYDLSEEWKQFSNKGFVFARWVALNEIDGDFVKKFESALNYGVQNRMKVIQEQRAEFLETQQFDIGDYLNQRIQFRLEAAHLKGQELFMKKIGLKTDSF